jgi:hypothetical protein
MKIISQFQPFTITVETEAEARELLQAVKELRTLNSLTVAIKSVLRAPTASANVTTKPAQRSVLNAPLATYITRELQAADEPLSCAEIHGLLPAEVSLKMCQKALGKMVTAGRVERTGSKRASLYKLIKEVQA